MLVIRTLAVLWPAMLLPAMQIASDVGRVMRTTKIESRAVPQVCH